MAAIWEQACTIKRSELYIDLYFRLGLFLFCFLHLLWPFFVRLWILHWHHSTTFRYTLYCIVWDEWNIVKYRDTSVWRSTYLEAFLLSWNRFWRMAYPLSPRKNYVACQYNVNTMPLPCWRIQLNPAILDPRITEIRQYQMVSSSHFFSFFILAVMKIRQ